MSDEDDDKAQQSTDEKQHTPGADDLSDEGKEKVQEMTQAYDDDRPTAVLPGTDNTITGVAVNEWLDDDGNPKFGKEKQQEDGAGKPDQDAVENQAKDAS